MVDFVRQLGAQPGIQLNPLQDNGDGFAPDNSDQIFALTMRATRGRIDQAFSVNAGNFKAKLGSGEALRINALNEAHIQVYEALNSGATAAVVARLSTDSAVLNQMIASTAPAGSGAVLVATVAGGAVTGGTVTDGGENWPADTAITVGGPGAGAVLIPTIVEGVITALTVEVPGTGYTTAPPLTPVSSEVDTSYTVAATPTGPYLFAIKHLECFNDGASISYHADELLDPATSQPIANPLITFRLLDANGVSIVGDIVASLDPTAVDDYGNSTYFPTVANKLTGGLLVPTVAEGATVVPTSDAYGRDDLGNDMYSTSEILNYFTEGGTGYTVANYQAASDMLQFTQLDYGYIVSGGSRAPALLSILGTLALNTNCCFKLDLPGNLSPAAAAAFLAQLGLVGTKDYYCHTYWSPIQSDDPLGINGTVLIGTAAFNVALACARNAVQDTNGFAKKNYPIAGKQFPLTRTSMTQIYSPSIPELSDMATAKINPVLFTKYNGGSLFVFTDSLTCATTTVSFKKLISVAEMSSSLDDDIIGAGREFLQYPMTIAIKKVGDYAKQRFTDAQTAGWLVPSTFPPLNGAAFMYSLAPNAQSPADKIDITYTLRYDGVARQMTVTQTLSR